MADFLRSLFGEDAAQQLTVWAMVLGTALLILLIGLWLARRLATLVRRAVNRRAQDAVLSNFIGHTVFVLLAMVVVVGALDRLGVPTASLLAALGAAGLAVGLALKDSLGNLASGVLLVVTRPFRAGDLVEAGGKQGLVERIDLLQTVLLTQDNCVVCVPNAAVMSQPIVNFTAKPSRRLDLSIAIAHDDDPTRAFAIIEQVLAAHAMVLREPAPQVAIERLSEGGVEIAVRPWVRTGELPLAQTELLAAIRAALTQAGFRYPQRVMRVLSPPQAAPAPDEPKDPP